MQLSNHARRVPAPSRLFAIQVRKDRIKRQCAVKPRSPLILPPVAAAATLSPHQTIYAVLFSAIRPAQGRTWCQRTPSSTSCRRILQPFFSVAHSPRKHDADFRLAGKPFCHDVARKQPAEYRLPMSVHSMTASRNRVHGKTQHVFLIFYLSFRDTYPSSRFCSFSCMVLQLNLSFKLEKMKILWFSVRVSIPRLR